MKFKLTIEVDIEAPSYERPSGKKLTKWKVKCECGTIKEVLTDDLRRGSTFSFGCYRREQSSKRAKHGEGGHNNRTSTYRSWEAMKRRCCAPNSKEFSRYGAIRISVCDRWLDEGTGYQSFLEDMGDRPPGTTLDRYPNRNGNYEPYNCRWGTPKPNSFNKASNLFSSTGLVRKASQPRC